ncbi:MAG: hypothetical protein KJP00_08140 [Bacteroidia bacterium]|nr:hypothetical protein [Bacteroidia bacterium]
MNRWKRFLIWIALIVLAFLLIGWRYIGQYGISHGDTYEVNANITDSKVLIAWQKSVYKEMLTMELVSYLEERDVNVNLMDIKKLKKSMLNEYDAIIIMHTWQMWRPPRAVRKFVRQARSSDKIWVISTSNGADLMLDNVDGITSASDINDAQEDIDQTITWLNKILSLETVSN